MLFFLNLLETVELEPEAKKKQYEKQIQTDLKGKYYDDDDPRNIVSTADTSMGQKEKDMKALEQGLKGNT